LERAGEGIKRIRTTRIAGATGKMGKAKGIVGSWSSRRRPGGAKPKDGFEVAYFGTLLRKRNADGTREEQQNGGACSTGRKGRGS